MIMDDEKIVDLYLSRNEDAISESEKKYGKRLRSLSLRIVESMETAEECENDTYLQAWESIPPNKPKTWLFAFLARIIRNISINRFRKMTTKKRNSEIVHITNELESIISSPDDTDCRFGYDILAECINSFLSNLEKEKRIVFMRRYWYGDSIRCIAKRSGTSESKIKTILWRIRTDLKDYLKKEGYEL